MARSRPGDGGGAGLVYPATFRYDEAGTVTFSPSAAHRPPAGMPISVGNGGNLHDGSTFIVRPPGRRDVGPAVPLLLAVLGLVRRLQATVAGASRSEQPATPATVSVTPQGTSAVSITGLDILSVEATAVTAELSAGVRAARRPRSRSPTPHGDRSRRRARAPTAGGGHLRLAA